jgi:hypothetical protein
MNNITHELSTVCVALETTSHELRVKHYIFYLFVV